MTSNLSAKERMQQGRARRNVVTRAVQANLKPDERQFAPIDVLRASAESRLPQLLPIKYARMRLSPFAFFRGAVSIMAADLGRLPNSGLEVQLCGDAHVQNMGSFATPDGKLVFDINDFDETIRGPWEWDVKRMATSIILAGRESGHGRSGCRSAAETFVESYCRSIDEFSQMPLLSVARHQIHRQRRIQRGHEFARAGARILQRRLHCIVRCGDEFHGEHNELHPRHKRAGVSRRRATAHQLVPGDGRHAGGGDRPCNCSRRNPECSC